MKNEKCAKDEPHAEGEKKALVKVSSNDTNVAMTFTHKNDAEVAGKAAQEKRMVDLSSVFIPTKEILSNSWNLSNVVQQGNIIFDDTYLDIIAMAEVNVASGKDNSRKKKYLDELKKTARVNHPGFCIRKLGWLLLKRENKR